MLVRLRVQNDDFALYKYTFSRTQQYTQDELDEVRFEWDNYFSDIFVTLTKWV